MAEGGKKLDQDKPRMDLLDPLALEGLAKVLTFGAKKYDPHNWRGGIAYCRLIAASLRHIFSFLRGEDTDSESGLPHVDHAFCCLMFLSNMVKTRKDLDDRHKPVSNTFHNVVGISTNPTDYKPKSVVHGNSSGEQQLSLDGI